MAEYRDRVDAGNKVAQALQEYKDRNDVIVLGLARGGVVLAAEVARLLDCSFDCLVPRKIGAPNNSELAVGALTPDGEVILNQRVLKILKEKYDVQITDDDLEPLILAERKEAARRMKKYRYDKPPLELKGKMVIVVDDGMATGTTMKASCISVRSHKPAKIICAIPVSSPHAHEYVGDAADEIISLLIDDKLSSINDYYDRFDQTTDDEVVELLR